VVTGIAAGLHVIVTLPERFGPQGRLLRRAGRAGLALRPLSDYEYGGGTGRAGRGADGRPVRLVVGYAHLPPSDIVRGVRLLGGL
jgi:GntR family transcriptional regulator/MocR family aminotransferase